MLTELNAAKRHLDIAHDDDSEDTFLDQLIKEVDAGVKSYLGRNVEQQTITNEYHDGHGRQVLFLREWPVTAVSDVRVDAAGYAGQGTNSPFDSDSALTQGEDFFMRRTDESEHNVGELIRIGRGWQEGIGNIRVAYTGGYSTVPLDLELAVHNLIARLRETADKGHMLASERLGSYSYKILQTDKRPEIGEVKSILGHYKRVVI